MLKGIINSKAKEGTAQAWLEKIDATHDAAAEVCGLGCVVVGVVEHDMSDLRKDLFRAVSCFRPTHEFVL